MTASTTPLSVTRFTSLYLSILLSLSPMLLSSLREVTTMKLGGVRPWLLGLYLDDVACLVPFSAVAPLGPWMVENLIFHFTVYTIALHYSFKSVHHESSEPTPPYQKLYPFRFRRSDFRSFSLACGLDDVMEEFFRPFEQIWNRVSTFSRLFSSLFFPARLRLDD